MKLNDKQIADYFHRSFMAVDGFWFVKAEEKYGIDVAIALDKSVWEVFPKIQARELKIMLGVGSGIAALKECLTTALTLKGFKFAIIEEPAGFNVDISECPWHVNMVRSGREKLSKSIGNAICPIEYAVWAKEFGDYIIFSLEPGTRLCAGGQTCIMRFTEAIA